MNRKSPQFILTMLALAVGTSGSPAETVSPNASQKLLFHNGDSLLGNLESIGPDKSVVWKRGDVLQAIEFSGTNIAEILFPSISAAPSTATNACRLQLRNGDLLSGKFLALDSEKVTLETAFAGKLVFPRTVVQSLEPLPPEREPLFTGPSGLEGWTMGKVIAAAAGESGEWKYTNAAFYATLSSSIARDLHLPDLARIEFDLAWKGMLQSAIALYTEHMQPINLANKDNEPDFGGFYSLQLNTFVATLMPVKKNEPLKYLGQVAVPQFNQKNSAHIEVRANKKRGSVALYVDDVFVKEWIDPDGFVGTGTALRFVHQGGQGSLKLSNLRVAEWDGKMNTKSTNVYVGKVDLADLANGDKVSGKLEHFREGKMTFSTDAAKLDIPMNRIDEIHFAGSAGAETNDLGPNIRAFLHDGGRVTLQIESWKGNTAVGASPNFGRSTFVTSAFKRIQVNSLSVTNKVQAVQGELRFIP